MDVQNILLGEIANLKLPFVSYPFLDKVRALIKNQFPEGDPERISSQIDYKDLVFRLDQIRNVLYSEPQINSLFLPIINFLNLDPNFLYMDFIRIRCVPHNFHLNPGSESVSYLHRDCWYANPQCQLNLWIPLSDIKLGSGFTIYPDYFHKPIKNNSSFFDYNHWLETGGFQAKPNPRFSEKIFPTVLEPVVRKNILHVFGGYGSMFLFSSHHLHGTENNTMGYSRFSLEIRFILKSWIEDFSGPKNLDNESKGTTLFSMRKFNTYEILPENIIQNFAIASAFH
ncbi:hypothetical protein P3G55_15825 [Leptospira sp. 96542]|nr:hypothetical protein [Leptospira sp. 96542]